MASKKPKGLTITRKKNKYILAWKKGETYGDGQRLIWGYTQVTKNGSKSTKIKWESSTIKLSASKSNYTVTIPSTYTDIANVYFKVRGKADNKEWSAWENETFKLDAPKPPTVTAEWNSEAQNKTNFNYTAKDEDHQPYDHIVYQSILVSQCPDNYKIESMWADAYVGELGGTSGNIQMTDSYLVGSQARIIRMKTVGQGGSSAWRYAHHVYASPYAPENVKVDAKYNEAWQYTDITVTWTNTIIPMQAPIDKTTVEYTIGVPTADDGLPTGATWTEMTPLAPVTDGAWQGRIYSQVAADECLFVRVVNTHDNYTMSNTPVIAYRAKLTSPTISSVTPNSGTHTIQVVLVLGTANPDGRVAITYRDPDTGVVGVLGIATAIGTHNVVVPAWTENPGNIGAYAFVGESTLQTTKADGTKIYSVEPIVTSDTVWNGTPTAPTITAVRKDEETVTVSWNWPWADATNAEISWADHQDAWESTAQPQTYDVANFHAATWNIGDLEQGKTWYFRVRLFYGENDTNIYGEYSNTVSVNLSSAPDTPVITLSDNVVKREGSVTVSWVYTSTDGTKQSYAEIYERRINGEFVNDYLLKTVTSGTSTEINVEDQYWWGEGYKANIAVKVFSESGQQSGFSNMETLTIAEPLTCTIAQDSLVYDDVEINPETVTGDPATFDGGQDNIKEVTSVQVPLEPHQAGTPWQDSTLYKTPFLFRKTPSVNHSINSKYTTLVGADVAENQLADMTTTTGTRKMETWASTITIQSSSVKVETTRDYTEMGFNFVFDKVLAKGHKYLLAISLKSTTFTPTLVEMALMSAWSTRGGFRVSYAGDGLYAYIIDCTADGVPTDIQRCSVRLIGNSVTGDNFEFNLAEITDLTAYYGSSTIANTAYTKEQATAGSGIAWLKANGFDFSKYRAYNAGSLESVNPSAIVTRGFNQWDGETESGYIYNGSYGVSSSYWRTKNFIKVLPNTEYCFSNCSGDWQINGFDAGQNFVGAVTATTSGSNKIAIMPENCYYIKFYQPVSISADTVCVNISKPSGTPKNGDYRQYSEHEYDLGNVPLHGVFKEENGNIVAYGDVRSADGNVSRKFKKITVTGANAQGADVGDIVRVRVPIPDDSIVWTQGSQVSEQLICADFVEGTNDTSYNGAVCVHYRATGTHEIMFAFGNSFSGVTNSSEAATWLNNHPQEVVYALATPTTDTADPFTSPQVVDADGTEEFVTSNDVPVGNNTRYADVYEITGTDEVTVTVADDPDNPTTSEDYTTDLTQTVYEGTVDVVSGKLIITSAEIDPSTLTWLAFSQSGNTMFDATLTGVVGASEKSLCSAYVNGYTYGGGNLPNGYFRTYSNGIRIKNDAYTDATAFKNSLSGVQLVYELATPIEIDLTPTDIEALLGVNYVWSEQGEVTVRIADAVESGYFLDELPLTVTVTGAGNEGDTTMKIVRAENYAMERPDGKDYNGYEGDLIIQKVQAGEDQMTVDLAGLIGRLDDGAKYRIIATTQDQFGQSAQKAKDFVVRWAHQAVIATGTAVIDGDIAKITPTKPNGALDDDYVDIYRLSCDGPELIYTHAVFGETVVDPYPTIGDTGGYRLVLVTKNGDYITENEIPSWTDVTAGLDTKYQYIDFDGNRLPLRYNVELDETKQKIFDVTHYLGGSVQGDFLEGTEGSGSVSGTIPYQLDPDDFITLRELMRYTGLCHVRTKIGSNYVANVQVGDGSSHSSPGGLHKASLTIQQVDNPELDGVLLTDWQVS